MPQKTKGRTGAALPTTDTPDTDSEQNPPISDAGAYSGVLALPGAYPRGPSFPVPTGIAALNGMGGDTTRPNQFVREVTSTVPGNGSSQGSDDFAAKVARATNVPSKGGPPESELYAASGKGPVGRLKPPQESDNTTNPPEYKPPPLPTGSDTTGDGISRMLGPPGTTPIAMPTATPAATSTATPTATPTAAPLLTPAAGAVAAGPSAASAAAQGSSSQGGNEQPQEEEKTDYTPRSFSDPETASLVAAAYKAHPEYFKASDYSTVPIALRNDPNFAGLAPNGQPLFVDPARNGAIYAREDMGLGHERRWYAQPSSAKELTEGFDFQDEEKTARSRDASQRLTSLIPAFQAIKDYQDAQARYSDLYGEPSEGQKRALVELNKTGTDWGTQTSKWWSNWQGHLNPDLLKLEQLRNVAANAASQALNKSPISPQEAASLQTPETLDTMDLQKSRMDTIRTTLLRQFQTLRAMYPYAAQSLKDYSSEVLRNAGIPASVDLVNPTRGLATPRSQPSAAPTPTTTAPVTISSRQEFENLKSGQAFIDGSGRVRYKK